MRSVFSLAPPEDTLGTGSRPPWGAMSELGIVGTLPSPVRRQPPYAWCSAWLPQATDRIGERPSISRILSRVPATRVWSRRALTLQSKRWWFRLREKGSKLHDMPARNKAEEYFDADA